MNKKSVLPALFLALLAWTPLRAATSATFQISNLVFDHSMLFNMVNTALNNPNGLITDFNAGSDAGVVSVTIHNTSVNAGYAYFVPIVRQFGSGANCGGVIATGPVLQTRDLILPGQTVVANVSNIEIVSGQSFNGTGICPAIKNELQGNFGGNGGSGGGKSNALSAAGSVVNELNQLQLSICLELSNQSGSPSGEEACTSMSIFAAPPSQNTTSAVEVYPNNTSVSSPLPNFIWTPAMFEGSTLGLEYELVLSQSVNGNPWYGVMITSGQTFYQWQATDRALQAGQKYWWHVIVLQASTGKPVGGTNGQGWIAPQSWFNYAPMGSVGAGAAVVTLQQLGALVQSKASPSVLNALSGMQLEGVSPFGSLSDPDVAALVAKPTEIKNISVEKF
jgi:hypothetical protein